MQNSSFKNSYYNSLIKATRYHKLLPKKATINKLHLKKGARQQNKK